MKRILCWLCCILILMTCFIERHAFLSASPSVTAVVTDVYASGNWTVGCTVTANYKCYDFNGNPQTTDALVEWWRTSNLVSTDEKISESLSYTLTSEDKGGVYFTVTVSDSNGNDRIFYSPLYLCLDADKSATKPENKKLQIILTGGAQSFEPGATVRAVHNTSFLNGKDEGATSYMWRVKNSRNGSYTVRAYTPTYTITDEDYGKWLECAVTVKDVDGNESNRVTSIVFVGNCLDFDATVDSITGTYSKNANLINRLWYQSADLIYTYKNVNVSSIIDAHKIVKFDGFNLNLRNVASDLKISYSGNGTVWTDFPLTGTTNGNVNTLYTLEQVAKARYFKVSFKTDSSNYGIFYEAFPCMTAGGINKDFDADIESVGYGAQVDNDCLIISGIINGISAKALTESIVTMNAEAVVSCVDSYGLCVLDGDGIKLTSANIGNYFIKVDCGSVSQTYVLVAADNLKKIDFSNMPPNKKYTEESIGGVVTGYTKDIPGTAATYWYGSSTEIDNYSYAIREDVGGSAALKIVNNNNGKSEVASLWSGVSRIDSDGCYSFSFKVKPGNASYIKINGRPNTDISGPKFKNNFVEITAEGITVYNGAEFVRKSEFEKAEWHLVEVTLDYKNNLNSVWVDGVNYAGGVPFEIESGEYDKTGLLMNISIFQETGGGNDVNYIKDIVFNRIADVNTSVTAFLYGKKRVVLNKSDINAMLISGEKIVTSESTDEKKKQVDEYISCTTEQFDAIVENALPLALDERSAMEIQLCRLAQLYDSEGKPDYADKVYNALVKFANNHFVIKEKNTTVQFGEDGRNLQPIYPAIAYSLLADYSASAFDRIYNTDTRALIESWLKDTVEITYNQFSEYVAGNMTGFTVKHIAGIGTILTDPDIMRKAIYITDKVMAPELWFADGVWWEGTFSYAKQIYGNLKEVFPLISKFVDPQWYVDDFLNISLDGDDISLRYPMINAYEEAVEKAVNPDGTAIAVNDTHFTYSSVVDKNLPIKPENLNNVEFNHFGLFALNSGNTQNAQQVSLLISPILMGAPFSGGHYHGSFLTMTLWAAGQELLPDAGYPFQTENYRAFHTSAVAHNGSFIWDNDASNYAKYRYLSARPNLLRYDDGTQSGGNIQLIEAGQLMDPAMGVKDKRRLLMQIKTSENTSYVFDLQTLEGGDVHENFLRASEDEDVNVGVSAVKTGSTPNLGVYLSEREKGGLMAKQTLFTDADLYSGNDMNFYFEGARSGAKLNAFVKGVENSMVAFSNMPSLRRTGGDYLLRDEFSTKHFYQRREVTANDVTHFAAVYEGVSSAENTYVENVLWSETDDGVFALIDMGEYEDIICISDELTKKEFQGIIFEASVGWVRRTKNGKDIQCAYVNGGGKIYTDSGVLFCEDTFESEISFIDSDSSGKNGVVLENKLPEELVGKWANMTFSDGSGISYKIIDSDENTVYTHNDVGFEYDNQTSLFTSFPAKKHSSGSLRMAYEYKYADFSNRCISGDVKFKIINSSYGALRNYISVYENGLPFQKLNSDSTYTVSGYSDKESMLFAVVYDNSNIHKIFMSQNGEDIEFSVNKELFEPDENGMLHNIYVKCMLWDKNLVPLCKNILLI